MSFRSLLVLLALATAAPAAAQEIPPGDRLRTYAPSIPARDSVSLLLGSSYERTARVPLAPIERISPRGKRTLLGALAGFALSTVAVVASDPGSWDCGGEFCGLAQSVAIVSGATVAGAVIGYTTH